MWSITQKQNVILVLFERLNPGVAVIYWASGCLMSVTVNCDRGQKPVFARLKFQWREKDKALKQLFVRSPVQQKIEKSSEVFKIIRFFLLFISSSNSILAVSWRNGQNKPWSPFPWIQTGHWGRSWGRPPTRRFWLNPNSRMPGFSGINYCASIPWPIRLNFKMTKRWVF